MAKLSYKVSYYIMYICFALILVVLGMFYFVGYNNPVGEYNAPEQDYDFLYKAGVAAIFGPGTPVAKAACQILEIMMDEE